MRPRRNKITRNLEHLVITICSLDDFLAPKSVELSHNRADSALERELKASKMINDSSLHP